MSCIVGPNGCGKSNIVDALKWCMGEQSAKSLRGGDMLDVIFGGSAERPPMGFAEVSITFSAEEGEPFPGEYARFAELSVGRRLHRTGASEYFMGGGRCRRRDIVELFMDTGIGNNLYSFIEQGSIGKIVHASPLERRALIDEAAGISKYKIRRKEAQSRLEATATQLDRAADVADEMGRRLKELERQVLRAARFRRLRARQRQDEVLLALAKFADLSTDRRRLRKELREARGRAEQAERQLVRRERELAGRREELELCEQQVSLQRDELAELDASLREAQGAQGFAERRVAEIEADKARWSREVAEAVAAVEAATTEEAQATASVEDRVAEVAELAGREAALRDALRLATADRSAARRVVGEADGELSALAAKIGAGRARAEGLKTRAESIPVAEAGLRAQIEECGEAAEAGRGREQAIDLELAELVAKITQATGEEATTTEVLAAAQKVERESEEQVRQAQLSLETAEQRSAQELETAERGLRRGEEERQRLAAELLSTRRAATGRARQGHSDRLRAAERVSRERVAGASERAEQWIAAARTAAEQASRRRRAELGTRRSGLEDGARALRAEAERVATAERLATMAALRERQATSREDAARGLTEAKEARQAAGEQLADLRGQLQGAEGEEAELRGRLQAASARLGDLTAAAAGSGAVAAALDALPVLGDLVDLDEASESVLGDRLNLKVATETAQVLAAAEAAREGGTGRALFVPRGRGALGELAVSQIDRAVDRVDSLEEALSAFSFSGRASVVVSTGEGVQADGVVLLGGSGEGARAAVEARQLRDEAKEALALQTARSEALRAAVHEAEGRSAEATAVEEARAEAIEALIASHEQDRQQALNTAAERLEVLRAEAEEAVEGERRDLAQLEQQAEEYEARAQLDLDAMRRSSMAAVNDERRAADDGRAQADVQSERALEAELAAIDAVEAATGPDLGPLREAVTRARDAGRGAVSHARTVLADLQGRSSEARRDVESARESRRRATEHKSELELLRAERGSARIAVRGEVAALAARVSALQAQVADLHRDAARVSADRAEAADAMAQLEERQRSLSAAASEARAVLDGQEGREEESREALSRWQRDLATATERQRAAQTALDGASRRVRDAAAARLKSEERVAASLQEQEELVEEAAKLALSAQSLATRRAGVWDKLELDRERVKALRAAWHEVEDDLRRLVGARDDNAKECTAVELRVAEVKVEVDALKQRMDERYQLSLPGLLDRMEASGSLRIDSDPLAAETLTIGGRTVEGVPPSILAPSDLFDFDAIRALVEEVEARREKIARLGDVHLGALEEYRELEARHADLLAQRADLEESMASIRSAIAKMNRTSRQRFRDAFDRVDEHFQELYPRLVGGGRSRLSLTDEDDLLSTGVDIFVQPPGKRLQNLSLLSGGEKAMSAIALLMALFKVRPSPFCVLDEVDAPLDEANGGRFNEMIREMSGATQFLVVTHNKKTMESGDTLYGITMPTPGASRVVSVRIDGDGP